MLRPIGPLSAMSTSAGRCLGFTLIAHPKRINCTMGIPIIIAKVKRSRFI